MNEAPFRKILIANRGEISIRIGRAAAELGVASVAIHPDDDAMSLHVLRADSAHRIPGVGAAAYLNVEEVVRAAVATGCDALHPGYGFLSESSELGRACQAAGIVFIGPRPEALDLFGDKGAARRLAKQAGIPLALGTESATTLEEARAFLASLGSGGAVMIKAVAGGGGRGMRAVHSEAELDDAFARASSEAKAAFGSDAVYIEEFMTNARHIEVQVIADASGNVSHLYERECSLQRRYQKVVEIAPAPCLPAEVRGRLAAAAIELARIGGLHTLCTFEFLLDGRSGREGRFVFMEANPRLQVEHTVTEEVTGVDLVRTQIELAAGRTLASLALQQSQIGPARGTAVQLRINMERVTADGSAVPTGGRLSVFEIPGGRDVRIDTFGYAGYQTSAYYDSLLAKLIVRSESQDLAQALDQTYRAACEFRIEGVETNLPFLQSLISDDRVRHGELDTAFIERNARQLLTRNASHPKRFASLAAAEADDLSLVALHQPEGTHAVTSPLTGRLISYTVAEGDLVRAESTVAIVEAMKMEHAIPAGIAGTVRTHCAAVGDTMLLDAPLVYVEPGDYDLDDGVAHVEVDPDAIRPDLREVLDRHAELSDEERPDAVARRRKTGQRTARENVTDLCDPNSFIEYGALALAAQRQRRSVSELREISPADGLIAGIGTINAQTSGVNARCAVLAYDYTVFAGTQGFMGHKKTDRLLHLCEKWNLPIVIFAEGGGGRPGETDYMGVAGLDMPSFKLLASLSGKAPSVAIVSGRCFAGNAAFAGACDLIIATKNASLGMGGPAMIEGGGLGRYAPEEVGPAKVQAANGVIDVLVEDEAEAVAVAKRYMSYFQGRANDWTCRDQRLLRAVVPENRSRAYDIRQVIELLADEDSVLELRPSYGMGIITALVRIEGHAVGLFANNPHHLGGAIDGDAADKAARFIELCEAYALPIISLCDTPGFMVGPEAEKTALVRRVSRMFVGAANITVPLLTLVLRKGYGLGAQAMAGGSTIAPFFTVSWPSGEFGGMGIEGAVNLAYRKELAAIEDEEERRAQFAHYVEDLYQNGKATNMASFLEIDGVIDPVHSRHWIVRALNAMSLPVKSEEKRRPFVTPR
ncbi:Acetyl-coenzyme A carboxylase carboxyl transferase subunit beta, chloroplastic [compost metagenome]